MENYCRAGQVTDDNMEHAHYILDTYDYKHALRTCNNYCFPTTTMVARTRLIVTFYVHWLCCVLPKEGVITGRESSIERNLL